MLLTSSLGQGEDRPILLAAISAGRRVSGSEQDLVRTATSATPTHKHNKFYQDYRNHDAADQGPVSLN
jgi:hypothetical protein